MIVKVLNKRLIYAISFATVICFITWLAHSKGKDSIQVKWDNEK